jgi:hypothetical protein
MMLKTKDRVCATGPDMLADWEDCWENILRLPIEALSDALVYVEAKEIVRAYRSIASEEGIGWFEWQVLDAQLFVAEQLAGNPDDPEWHRIDMVLAGAHAGCSDHEH